MNSSTWIIDSDATKHMCLDSKSFSSMSLLKYSLTINLPNCQIIQVSYTGTICLFSDIILLNVLYVPNFKYNLMSVYKFFFKFQCRLLFTPNKCLVQDSSLRRCRDFGKVNGGLYLLRLVP